MTFRRGMRLVSLALIAFFYIASVPWYRDTQAPLSLWFGLPDWVAVALLCYVGVAVFNAIAWLLSDVSDELDDDIIPHDSGVDRDSGDPAFVALGEEAAR